MTWISAPPPGHLLDSFARSALWESGLDYLHGTGHGVGCFLNVHEGPCGISYKTFADEPLEAGMIVSDGTARRSDPKISHFDADTSSGH